MNMNPFLEKLFDIVAIDTEHLISTYLNQSELQYLNNHLAHIEDLKKGHFYSDKEGENLEVLLYFLLSHKEDISLIWEDNSKKEILLKLYKSSIISGNYSCFRFDLSKFPQTYKLENIILTLYRIGRKGETRESLGNSWSKDGTGLKNYALSSSINIEDRPVFVIKINDSEVLFQGNSKENELVLKKDFKLNEVKILNPKELHELFGETLSLLYNST